MLGHGCARLMCRLWPWAMIIGGNDGMQDKTDIRECWLQSNQTIGNTNLTKANFVAFICSCFGALGPSAVRYLSGLAMLELSEHNTLRSHQGIDPSDDSERAQYRANFFRSSSARIATAMAKAQSCAWLVLHFFL